MATVYRIAKWTETFERAETRKLKTLHWVSMPLSFNTAGFHAMVDHFGDEFVAAMGTWDLLVRFVAQCECDRRGILADRRGNPLTLAHISRVTCAPVEWLRRVIEWAATPEVGWIETIDSEELNQPEPEPLQICTVSTSSGESPDDLPPRQENSPSTRPNITRQDTTEQNKTISRRSFDWSTVGKDFWDSVREIAIQMADMAAKGKLRQIDRDDIWRMAWVANELDRPGLLDALARIRTDDVKKPKGYLGTVMVRMCEAHGCSWDDLKLTVPPTPPPSRPAPNHHGGNHAEAESTAATVAAS